MTSPLPSKLVSHIQLYGRHVLGVPSVPAFNHFELEQAIFQYLDRKGNNPTAVDALFNEFAGSWSLLYQTGKFNEAEVFWQNPLTWAMQWECSRGRQLHKGTPYYFMGMASIRAGHRDLAFLLMHQAVEEDKRAAPSAYKDRPAWRFVTLDVDSVHQAASPIVREHAQWLENKLLWFTTNRCHSLSLSDLRNRVFALPNMDEATFSFVHSTFRCRELEGVSNSLGISTFSAQLCLDTLFPLCRVGEELLKYKQPPIKSKEKQIGGQISRFFGTLGSSLDHTAFSVLNHLDLSLSIGALLSASPITDSKGGAIKGYSSSEADLLLVYVLRNAGGHRTDAPRIVAERYEDLLQRALSTLFLVAATLY